MSSNIVNWPPAKGPKPPHLQVTNKRIESKPPIRSEFKFKQPADAALERAILLDSIGDPEVAKIPEGVKVVHPANDYRPTRSIERDFTLSHHIGSIASLSALDARKLISGWSVRRKKFEWLLPPRVTTVAITYPLSLGVKLKITPYHYVVEFADDSDFCEKELSLGYVLWRVAKEYVRIYEDWKRYKIWGHELWDLWFKRLTVTKSGRAELVVES